MKRFLMIGFLLFSILALTFAGGKPAKPADSNVVTLTLGNWSTTENDQWTLGFAGLEEELGIKVTYRVYPSDSEFWDKIPAEIAAGTSVDMVVSSNEHYLQFINQGLFLPLDDAIADGTININQLISSALESWQLDGVTYGIPYSVNPGLLIINVNLWKQMGFGAYPQTWDDVLEICKEYKAKTGKPALVMNIQEYHLTNYALSFGGGWGFGKTINTPQNAKALQFIIDAYRNGYSITPSELGLGWDGAVMLQGETLFSTGGPWYYSSFREDAPDIELKYLPVPRGAGAASGLTLHTGAIVALKGTKHLPEIKKAIGYAYAHDALARAVVDVSGMIPADKNMHSYYRQKFPMFVDLIDYSETGKPFGYPSQSKRFADALISEMQSVMFDRNSKRTGQDIVTALARQFQ
ncbi:MAG: extracellular solute-binding protein [Treponema sp.]|jgi:multiple sugar transport system substrate-binding protein|nr:extracellular solute-binding protein [Treponema sp.]